MRTLLGEFKKVGLAAIACAVQLFLIVIARLYFKYLINCRLLVILLIAKSSLQSANETVELCVHSNVRRNDVLAVCPPGRMPCDNGECIEKHLVCNGKYDCSDHSEEKYCPSFPTTDTGNYCLIGR